jgi:hypothetical protein
VWLAVQTVMISIGRDGSRAVIPTAVGLAIYTVLLLHAHRQIHSPRRKLGDHEKRG